MKTVFFAAGATLLALFSVVAAAQVADDVVAKINNHEIVRSSLDAAVYAESRQRFYHGRVGDDELVLLRYEVLDSLIDRVLLLEEAARRDLKLDDAAVVKAQKRLLANYNMAAMPKDHRSQLRALLFQQAREDLLLKALEAQIRSVGEPSQLVLNSFYAENHDKFTTPPRLRLSVILLKVQPSASVAVWRAAEQEAGRIISKLRKGGAFEALAEMHSGDSSAANGGSLGFVHQGMLADGAQRAVDPLGVGEISEPVVLLQGVALFRLDERDAARLNSLEKVKERAIGLWQRENGELAWSELLGRLRVDAELSVFDKHLSVDAGL